VRYRSSDRTWSPGLGPTRPTRSNKAIGDSTLRPQCSGKPGPTTCVRKHSAMQPRDPHVSLHPRHWGMMSSTKPEVLNALHRRQRKKEPWQLATCTQYSVKFGRVVFEICRLTYRHVDHNTSCPYRGLSSNLPGVPKYVINSNTQYISQTTKRL